MNRNFVDVFKKLKKCLYKGKIFKNADLKEFSSYKIGGRAKILVEVTSIEEIFKVLSVLEKTDVKFKVIGKGTNLLFSDKGFEGVIVEISSLFNRIEKWGSKLIVDGGASLNSVVAFAIEHGLQGMEEGAGIPGSVGGAVYMNANAYSYETGNVVSSVLAIVDGKIRHFTKDECQFGYRKSIFQSYKNPIIIRVEFSLKRGKEKEIRKTMVETLSKRKQNQPLEYPSCGSVFKHMEGIIVSKLIDDMGFKGRRVGGAVVSTKHANFIVNDGNAIASDVLTLIEDIKREVYEKHNLKLETEVEYIE